MARFGRTRLLGVTVKRFLVQAKRHAPAADESLPEPLRTRYAPSVGKLFSQKGQTPDQKAKTLQQVAEDARDLLAVFHDDVAMSKRPSYLALARAFADHCEVIEDRVTVRAKSRSDSLQNPSDLDATYDGHKGQGYQVQLAETCGESEVQLIVAAVPQTASEHDAHAVKPILESLKSQGLLPESLLADTAYGSDENAQLAAKDGVELVSPVGGPKGEATPDSTAETPAETSAMGPLSIDDFAMDERTGQVDRCPAGRIPLTVACDANGKTTVEMTPEDCGPCSFFAACPMAKRGRTYALEYTAKQRRLEERRREQSTAAFDQRYSKRSGLESTNGGLKRRLGLGRLRVRGLKAVSHAVLLRVAGWNVLQAVRSKVLMAKVRAMLAERCLSVGC